MSRALYPLKIVGVPSDKGQLVFCSFLVVVFCFIVQRLTTCVHVAVFTRRFGGLSYTLKAQVRCTAAFPLMSFYLSSSFSCRRGPNEHSVFPSHRSKREFAPHVKKVSLSRWHVHGSSVRGQSHGIRMHAVSESRENWKLD